MTRLLKILFIALTASVFSLLTPLYSIENNASYEYAEEEELIEIGILNDSNEFEVNLMCVEGLSFDRNGYYVTKTANGWECRIFCSPAKGHTVFKDGMKVSEIEVIVSITNLDDPNGVEAQIALNAKSSHADIHSSTSTKLTYKLTFPNVSLTSKPSWYIYEDDFSDISFGFEFE